MSTKLIFVFLFINYCRAQFDPASEVVAPNNQGMDSPSKEVVVQHPVTVSVHAPEAMTTKPPVAPLKTRVVVVHNNMVPVPIECFQPPDSGTCSKDLARIYYDHETRTCKPFSYTGCGGNANRFQSIKNCYRICHPYRYKIRPKIARKNSGLKVRALPAQPAMDLSMAAQAQQQAAMARSMMGGGGMGGGYPQQCMNAQPVCPPGCPPPSPCGGGGGYGGGGYPGGYYGAPQGRSMGGPGAPAGAVGGAPGGGQINPLTQKHVIMTPQGPQVKNQVVGQGGGNNMGQMNNFQPQG